MKTETTTTLVVTGGFGHCSEKCRSSFGPIRYACSLLDDPHGECFRSSLFPLVSSDVSVLPLAYDDCCQQVVDNVWKVDEDSWKGGSWSGDLWGDPPPSPVSSLFADSRFLLWSHLCVF